MGVLYHGSKHQGIKRFEPHKSTHGTYVYATPFKALAIHFSGRCGDDMVYYLGRDDQSKPWQLVEYVPGAFEKMYSNSSSVYTFSDEKFKDIHTGFAEVVSEEGVDVLKEEYIPSVYDEMMKLSEQGEIIIYRYPNKPEGFKKDDSELVDKLRYYKEILNKQMSKHDFDRLIYLHPNLIDKANDLLKEFGIDYEYKKEDIISLFKGRIDKQLADMEHEQYVDCAYQNICNYCPELLSEIDELYKEYQDRIQVENNSITR